MVTQSWIFKVRENSTRQIFIKELGFSMISTFLKMEKVLKTALNLNGWPNTIYALHLHTIQDELLDSKDSQALWVKSRKLKSHWSVTFSPFVEMMSTAPCLEPTKACWIFQADNTEKVYFKHLAWMFLSKDNCFHCVYKVWHSTSF